ncbi:MAG TPA: hypothetical protein VKV15_08655 [Bryobacteraceae bacterium]|nr:hypothetical protein [Bryobacteraceae bacterium]
MRFLTPLAIFCLLTFPLAAQHRGGGGGGHVGMGHAGGSFHGGGVFHGGSYAGHGGYGMHGNFGNHGAYGYRGRGFHRGRSVFLGGFGLGFGYPYYYDPFLFDPFYYDSGYYDSGYYSPYPYGQGYASYPPAPEFAEPPVVINQNFVPQPVQPAMRTPPSPPPPQPSQPNELESQTEYQPTIYLLAFKDSTIRAAVAYWVSGNTLHYVTREHETRAVPLAKVDRDFSIQLNRERHVDLRLPSPSE